MKYFVCALLLMTSLSCNADYNRGDFGAGWIGSCLNTREEILIRDSEKQPFIKDCKVDGGLWTSHYDKKVFMYPYGMDIDHIVPLKYAYTHGAAEWPKDYKIQFANDPDNLLSVSASSNRSKGDKDPFRWMPPNKQYWCTYLTKWNNVVVKYNLTQDGLTIKFVNDNLSKCK